MQSAATIQDIQERLRELSPEQLSSVFDFVSYLLSGAYRQIRCRRLSPLSVCWPGTGIGLKKTPHGADL